MDWQGKDKTNIWSFQPAAQRCTALNNPTHPAGAGARGAQLSFVLSFLIIALADYWWITWKITVAALPVLQRRNTKETPDLCVGCSDWSQAATKKHRGAARGAAAALNHRNLESEANLGALPELRSGGPAFQGARELRWDEAADTAVLHRPRSNWTQTNWVRILPPVRC